MDNATDQCAYRLYPKFPASPAGKQAPVLVVFILGTLLGTIGALNIRESSNWTDPLKIRLNALKQNPSSISLKAYALNEVINSIQSASDLEKSELLLLRDQFKEELTQKCDELLKADLQTPDNQLANCHPFFRTGYLLNRSHKNWKEADRYFSSFEKASSVLNPIPKMVNRMRFENMLLKNQVDLKFVETWLTTNPYLPNSDYRILNLIGQCLVEPSKKSTLVTETISNRLLFPDALNLFINEKVAPPLKAQLETCLGLI